MVYAVDKKLPESFFVQILTEKANMLKKHLKDSNSSLVMCANIGPNVATLKLYNTNEEDSLKIMIHHIELRRFGRSTVPAMGTAKLFIMGTLPIPGLKTYYRNVYTIFFKLYNLR